MSEQQLVPFRTIGDGFTLNIIPEAIALRDKLIAECKAITVVDEATKKQMTEKVGLLKGLAKGCEACRVAEKAPAKAYGEQVDTEAKIFTSPINSEVARAEGSIGAYIRQQEEIVRKAREEEQRKAREAQAEEQERQRKLAEAQRLATEAKSKTEREKAAAEAKRLEDEEEQRQMDAAEAAPAQPVVIAAAANTKVSGGSVNTVPDIFIHDLHALYKAYPECVVLKENLSAIKNRIKLLQSQNQPIEIPGVEVSFKTDIRVRATAPKLSLQ